MVCRIDWHFFAECVRPTERVKDPRIDNIFIGSPHQKSGSPDAVRERAYRRPNYERFLQLPLTAKKA
jgi:hypothetical protein